MSLRMKSPMPDLDGATEWINADQPDVKELIGKPTLIYFWSVSCDVCHNNIPKLEEWRQKYIPQGLQMVSIHSPRQKADLFEDKVREVKKEYQITEPLAVDNRHVLLKAFQNEFFPAFFLYDSKGKLIRRASGNTGISLLAPILERYLKSKEEPPKTEA